MQKTITITNKKEFLNTLKTFKLNTEKNQEISKLTYLSIDYINKSLTIKNSDLDNYLINTFAIENDLTLPYYLIYTFAIENGLNLPSNQEFFINTKELLDAVNSCKKMDTLKIIVENNFITIGAFNLFFKNCEEMHQRDLEIFKKSIETEQDNLKNLLEFNIDKNLFIKNLKNSLNFVSNDETRLYLHGVAIKFMDNRLGFYATTGHVLIKISNFDNLDIIDNSNNNFFILPIKLCKNLVASADILKDNIKIIFNNQSFIKVFSENLKIEGRLFDAEEFPDANAVIPSAEAFKIELKTKAFFDAVKMANNVTDLEDNHNKIILNLNNNKLLLTKKKQDKIIFQLPLDFNSNNEVNDYTIIFNSKFLLKCIETYKNFTDQDNIFISFQTETRGRPAKIECLDNNKQVITILLMPIGS